MKINFTLLLLFIATFALNAQTKNWIAPKAADSITNTTKNKAESIKKGKELYKVQCLMCHGSKGNGKGPAGTYLSPKPANFTSEAVQTQTDGTLFWKMTNGNSPMAAYKDILTEKQRWNLVNYIRTFKN